MNPIPANANHAHPVPADTDRADTTTSENNLLDEFFQQYEAATSRAALLDEYCQRHPELADRCRALAAQIDRLRAAVAAAAPAEHLNPGQMLGPFCIVRELATGGMGVIYEARQIGLERRVALKTIRSDRASDNARERFVREQQALALLHHTHIVPIFASGTEADLQYYGMQFIQGVTLHNLIQRLRTGALATWPARGAGVPPAGEAACGVGVSLALTMNRDCVPETFPSS